MSAEIRSRPERSPLPNSDAWMTFAAPNHVLALLTIVSFFNYLDRMVIAILLEPVKQDLNLSDTQMGLVSGFAFAMLYASAGLPLARIADRGSRVRLLTTCLALWSAATALTGMVRNFWELFLVRMAVGVGEAGCLPASHSMLGDLYPRHRRTLAISIFQSGGILGQSAGIALAGIVAQIWGWRTALVVIGAVGIPLALLIRITVREPARAAGHAEASAESLRDTLRALAARPPLVHIIVGVSISAFGSYGLLQWVPTFFIRNHGLSLAETGTFVGTTMAVASVTGVVCGGLVLNRLGPRDVRWELWWPSTMMILGPVFYIASFLIDDWRAALGLQTVGAFANAAAGGVVLAALQSYAEPHRRATSLALLMLLSSLVGLGCGPAAVGALSDLLIPTFGTDSLKFALILVGSLGSWGAIHLWYASRSAKRWALP